MSDKYADWAEQEKRERAERKERMWKLLAEIPGLKKVTVAYYGSGDEGNLESPTYLGEADKQIEVPPEVDEFIESYVLDALEDRASGWEINDGSQGVAEIDVASRKTRFDHEVNYMSQESEPFED